MAQNTKNNKQLTSEIYKEVIAVLDNIGASVSLREAVNDLFEDKYSIETVRKTLGIFSWEEIAKIAASGKASEVFRVGDEKEITLYTGEKVVAVILGFNHDIYSDSVFEDDYRYAGITFGIKDLLDGEYEMNTKDTNIGSWEKSKMRTVYMPRFLALLPPELQQFIKPVVKLTGAGGGSDEIKSTDDKLFLFSQNEVIGDDTYTAEGEGEQYEYFKNEDNVTKTRDGAAAVWWLRSPRSNGTGFRGIGASGGVSYYGASGTRGVCFGFCI